MDDINNPYRDPRTGMSIYQVEMMERERQRMMYQMAENQRIAAIHAREAASQSGWYATAPDGRKPWGWREFVGFALLIAIGYGVLWVLGFIFNGFQV